MTRDEFKKLDAGDIVRHVHDDVSYLVQTRYSEWVLIARAQCIANPDEWLLIRKAEPI